MTPTIKELYSRKSVRVFTEDNISEENRNLILFSAMQAPTAGNMQMYTILDIQDQEKKNRLADLCDHQPFIAQAKLVLIFLADYRKWYDAFVAAGATPRTPEEGDLMLAVSDANIAAQNAVTAAESLGIGSCYIGDVMENYEEMSKLLNLPRYTFPCAMLVFGYPTQQQKERQKPERFNLEDIVCVDSYKTKNPAQLKTMFESRLGSKTFEEYMKAFCDRKYNSDFSREMSRSVRKYIETWTED